VNGEKGGGPLHEQKRLVRQLELLSEGEWEAERGPVWQGSNPEGNAGSNYEEGGQCSMGIMGGDWQNGGVRTQTGISGNPLGSLELGRRIKKCTLCPGLYKDEPRPSRRRGGERTLVARLTLACFWGHRSWFWDV